MLHRLAGLFLIFALAACSDAPEPFLPEGGEEPSFNQSGVIPGRFIVTVRDGVDPAGVARAHGVSPDYLYRSALNGFAGSISDAARAGLLRDVRVTRVEPDGIATIVTTQTMDANGDPWGLDRIDQRALPLSGTYTYSNTGSGVEVHIIDTGILTTHEDFGGRAVHGYDFVDNDADATDCHGHGTHVAGTTGGTTWGVAKTMKLVAVRVLDCGGSGTWSGVIAGVDWVTANHTKPAVANMSLGGRANSSVDDAVRNSIAAGVSYSIAAGNSSQDACRFSPARVAEAMTIGATTKTDDRATYSNVGNCIDWFAPGSGIKSAWIGSNTATNTLSGTSMAAPHTAGVAALYLQSNPGANPATVRNALYELTTKGVVKRSRTKNNHLLFTNF